MIMSTRLFSKFVVTLAVLSGLVFLVRAGVADFLRLAPCTYIESVQQGGRIYPADLVVAREQLLLARDWDGANPVVPEFSAQIALMRYRLVGFSPRLQALFLNEAIGELQRATSLRPNLPHLWAARMTAGSWLITVSRRGVADDALVKRELSAISRAMHRAYALGPSEPVVLQQIVSVGRTHYAELSAEDRAIVNRAMTAVGQLRLNI